MGNCTCSKVEERNEIQYTSNDEQLDILVEQILSDLFPNRRRSFDLATDTDDNEIEYDDDSDTEGNSVTPSNISFENESIVSRLEQIYVEDDTCAICAYNYDENQHVPRILPCGHTICQYCIRKMARKSKFRYFECPLDRKCHRIKPQHTVRPLENRQWSSSRILASERDNSDTYSTEFLQSNINTLDNFEQTHVDSTSDEVSESSILDISPLPVPSHYHTFNTENPNTYYTGQLPGVANANVESRVSQRYLDNETEVPTNESNHSDIDSVCTAGLNDMSQHTRISSQAWTGRHQGSGKMFSAHSDVIDECMRQKLDYSESDAGQDLVLVNEWKTRHDIYDDERSVRSFEWVEPDYSSESD